MVFSKWHLYISCATKTEKKKKNIVVLKNYVVLAPGGGLPYETDGDARRKF